MFEGKTCSHSRAFTRNELDGAGRVLLDDLYFRCPGEVPFQAHNRPVDTRRLEPEGGLEIRPVANQER